MAGRAVGTRSRAGLWVAALALALAVGLVFVVIAVTGKRASNSAAEAAGGAAADQSAQPAAAASSAPVIPKVKLALVGASNGLQSWKDPVAIHVSGGTLLAVKVTDDTGVALDGAMTSSSWTSSGQVVPLRTYQVQTYVLGLDGTKAYHTVMVKTSPPDYRIGTNVTLQTTKTVGVGFPIVVKFTKQVADADRAAVEKALTVSMSAPVTGAWHWFSPLEMHFRPQVYWPAGEQLTLHDHLTDVQMAPGAWGESDKDLSFAVGDAHVSTVDIKTQHMVVTVNGTVVHDYPVSTGRAEYPTKGGVHLVLEKFASKVMDSSTVGIPKFLPSGATNPAYYLETELWATRISYGGAFVHYQPLTLKEQGLHPASHGCVNTNLAAAEQFYNLSVPGDVVNVVNATTPPALGDAGMMDWNYTWAQWLAGSATQS